jgi:hypothetical protein
MSVVKWTSRVPARRGARVNEGEPSVEGHPRGAECQQARAIGPRKGPEPGSEGTVRTVRR